jgi:serine/threonine protein kinase
MCVRARACVLRSLQVIDKTRLSTDEAKHVLNEIAIMRILRHAHIVALWNVFEVRSATHRDAVTPRGDAMV